MNQRLIHPDLMDNLWRFFNSTCSIQSYVLVPGDYGETNNKTWSNVTTGINCDISRITNSSEGYEVRRRDNTIVEHPYGITLQGVYTITEENRIVSSSLNYNVLSVNYDSKSTMTSLICEIVT